MTAFQKNALTKPLSALALFAAAVSFAPTDAEAACCVAYDRAHVEQQHRETRKEVKDHFTEKLKETEDAIVEALKQHAGQMTTDMKRQTTADADMRTVQDQRRVQENIAQERLDAVKKVTSGASVCNVVTGAVAGQSLQDHIRAYREGVLQAQLEWDLGNKGASAKSGANAVDHRLKTHCAAHGTPNDKATGACTEIAPEEKQGKDLNANTLLGAKNGVLKPDDVAAAELFLSTILTPRPLGALADGAASTAEGRRLVAARHASAGRVSLANTIGTGLLADTRSFDTKVVVTGGETGVVNPTGGGTATTVGLKDWAEGTAKQTLGYDPNGNNFPDGVSKLAWLELRSKAWFMNPNWALKVDGQGVDQTAKDLAMMQSFQVYQNHESYKLLREINLSLATIISILEGEHREKL